MSSAVPSLTSHDELFLGPRTVTLYVVTPFDSVPHLAHRAQVSAYLCARPVLSGGAALGALLAAKALPRYYSYSQATRAAETARPPCAVLQLDYTGPAAQESTCGLPDFNAPGMFLRTTELAVDPTTGVYPLLSTPFIAADARMQGGAL